MVFVTVCVIYLLTAAAAGQRCSDLPNILYRNVPETTPVGNALFSFPLDIEGVVLTLTPSYGEPSGLLELEIGLDQHQIVLNKSLALNDINNWQKPVPFTEEHLNCTFNNTFTPRSPCDGLKESFSYRLRCSHFEGYETEIQTTVVIDETNDFPPEFHCPPFFKYVNELTPVGTTVFRFRDLAYDPDIEGGISTYNLQGGHFGDFQLTSVMKESLVVTAPLDYDSGVIQYSLNITTSDNQIPSMSSWTILYILLEDGDDQNPLFSNKQHYLSLEEQDASLMDREHKCTPEIYAFDQDFGIQAKINYRITEGNTFEGEDFFAINAVSGDIRVLKVLDREIISSFQLIIEAFQVDNPEGRTDVAFATIEVEDINDNPPVMTEISYTVEIPEHAQEGFVLLTVIAHDADEGDNAVFEYHIEDESGLFEICPVTGELKVLNSLRLDRETKEEIHLKVFARETLSTERYYSNFSDVKVLLSDINDNNPVFTLGGRYQYDASLELIQGETIGLVSASDADIHLNGFVRYNTANFQHDQRALSVAIDHVSGRLYAAWNIQAENGSTVRVFIEAKDQAVREEDRRSTIAEIMINFIGGSLPSEPSSSPAYTMMPTKHHTATATDSTCLSTQTTLMVEGNFPVVLGLLLSIIILCIITIVLLVICPRRFRARGVDKSSATDSDNGQTDADTALLLHHEQVLTTLHPAHIQRSPESDKPPDDLVDATIDQGLGRAEENSEVGEITHNLLYDLNNELYEALQHLDDETKNEDFIPPMRQDTPSFSFGKEDDSEDKVKVPSKEHLTPTLTSDQKFNHPSSPIDQRLNVSHIPGLALLDQVLANEGSASELPTSKASSIIIDECRSQLSCDTYVEEGNTIKVVGELPDTPRQQMEEDFIDHTFFTKKGPITIL